VPDDAMKAVIVIAAAVWHVANRNEMLPRFAKEKMPPLPAPPASLTVTTPTAAVR
jgi:hypothetical protein